MRGVGLLRTRGASLGACVALLAAVLSGCSSTTPTSSAVTVVGSTLDVYASQPAGPVGSVAGDVVDAEQLASKQSGGKAGRYQVKLISRHGHEISANARAAVQDKKAIAYLGEIGPGTSGVSVQITNQVGLLEVSPTDTAIYLSHATAAVSGAPGNYFPASGTFHQTFARLAPTTAQEAGALVAAMQSRHLTKLYIADDGSAYGASIALEVRQAAQAKGLTLASGVTDADAVFYGGLPGSRAISALNQAASARPGADLFAPSALYDDSFVARLSAAAQSHLYVTSPGFTNATLTPAGKQFVSAFRTAYGHAPQPQAIFGYEAMRSLLAVLAGEGINANSRALAVARFRTLHSDANSVLGTYAINAGDTSIAPFVIAHPAGGRLVPGSQP
ncbi:MAG: ABC transporter substrate-binding protein [Solirubrobacteraceae bacterium]